MGVRERLARSPLIPVAMPNIVPPSESFTRLQDSHEARAFYEGKWVATNRKSLLRSVLVKKERFFLKTLGKQRGTLLDLGCGGGWSFFTRFAPVVGVDLSHRSLCNARQLYSLGVQAEITQLPFADGSFDVVVSLDVLGHISFAQKPLLLQEIARVLKPGGITVHYIETLSDDPLSRFSRSHPDLHERYFVAPEGHIGTESAWTTCARFRTAGFLPIEEIPVYKGFIYGERFLQYFDNEFQEYSRVIRWLVKLLRALARHRMLMLATNLLITLGFELCDPFLPDSWAGGVLVSYRKPH